jgi:hypothetical protein
MDSLSQHCLEFEAQLLHGETSSVDETFSQSNQRGFRKKGDCGG